MPSALGPEGTSPIGPATLAIVALLAVALLAVAAIGPAAAAPPPKTLCGVCGDSLDGATGPGTLDVHVDENGDSRWIARVPIDDDAAERYRTKPGALEAAVDTAWHRWDVAADDARDVEASVADDAVVVEYSVDDVATPGLGDAWLLDYFYVGGTRDRYDLRAERVTIHPPDGYDATNEPPDANVEGGSVTWTAGEAGGNADFSRNTYVTYAEGGVGGLLESRATAAIAFGPLVAEHAAIAAVLPIAAFAGSTVLIALVGRRPTSTTRDDSDAGRAASLGDPLGFAGVGRAVVDRVDRYRVPRLGSAGLLPIVGVAAGVVGIGSWLLFGLVGVVEPIAFTVAVALFLPFGYALESGDRAGRYGLAASAAPAVPLVAFAPFASPVFVGTLYVPWALSAAVLGYPLSLLGRRLAIGAEERGDSTGADSRRSR